MELYFVTDRRHRVSIIECHICFCVLNLSVAVVVMELNEFFWCEGKTFTMYGNDDEPGIIFLTAQDLFRRFEEGTRSYFVRYEVVSFSACFEFQ